VVAADIPVIERLGGGGFAACWRKSTYPNANRAGDVIIRPCWELALKALIAYFLGTLLGGLILGRLRGVDIRSAGSGNAGATNAFRTQGKVFGLLVLMLDVGKGLAAVLWVPVLVLPGVGWDPDVSRQWLALTCGFAVILGHVYPVWFGFRGGKGVATMVGVIGALEPRLLVPLFSCWFIVVLLTGYVGLASMLAAGWAGHRSLLFEPAQHAAPAVFASLVTALVIYTHRGNIARMAAGTESRARRLWLFRSRTAKEPSEYSAWPRPRQISLNRGGADAVGSRPNEEATTTSEGKSARSRRVGKERGVCGVAGLPVVSATAGAARLCIRLLSLPTRLTWNTQTGS